MLKRAGVEFIDENGGGAGVRLRKRRSDSKQISMKSAPPSCTILASCLRWAKGVPQPKR